jgi:hypothetical protein
MRRRDFIAHALGAAAALPFRARAQGTIHRVGLILTTSPLSEMVGPEPSHKPFRLPGFRSRVA